MSKHLATELSSHTVTAEHVEEVLSRLQGDPGYGWGRHRGYAKDVKR